MLTSSGKRVAGCLVPLLTLAFSACAENEPKGPLSELMPAPQHVVGGVGCASEDSLARPKVVRAAVADAPTPVADQAYVLVISPTGATITASGRLGELYARTTLAQLVKLSAGGGVPCCRIVDWPMLAWRGFMQDTGRNFLDLDSLRDLIDHMAAYKLNLFHWHLTEYWGWRLASKRYPELEKKGYFDPFGHRHRGKFYSQEDFRSLVDYAYERGITVMPEFDVPGHSTAFREAFGFKSMSEPGVEETIANLFDELCGLAPKEKMPFVHMGGDEAWDEWEKVEEKTISRWAKVIADNGRVAVVWDDGYRFVPQGPSVVMANVKPKDSLPWIDISWYIEGNSPFEILNQAAYQQPFQGLEHDNPHLGAVFCSWHDSAVGLPYAKIFREVPIFPACVMLGDLFWHGHGYDRRYLGCRLPAAGDPLLAVAEDIERRTIAQRDRVLTDLRHPFHFVKQTQMRWRLTDSDGRIIAKDIAQASVYPYVGPDNPMNYYHSTTGLVYMETWIKSPTDRIVGAWIGFTEYDRDQGRSRAGGTPSRGQWNRYGAKITLNGEDVPPPVWEQPDLPRGEKMPQVRHYHTIDHIPYTNDEWYMREPTSIRLKSGWNHVRMTLPMNRRVDTWMTLRWVGTFVPVAGTTDHPREIPDLEYSSDPQ